MTICDMSCIVDNVPTNVQNALCINICIHISRMTDSNVANSKASNRLFFISKITILLMFLHVFLAAPPSPPPSQIK